jgi:hypothetical protein
VRAFLEFVQASASAKSNWQAANGGIDTGLT